MTSSFFPGSRRARRGGALLAVLALCACGLSACADEAPESLASSNQGCGDLTSVTGLQGTTVTVATPFTGVEAERFDESLTRFESCTGIDVVQNGSDSLEQNMRTRAQATAAAQGTAAAEADGQPDLAVLPQPGLVSDLVDAGALEPLPSSVNANVELGWDRVWAEVGTYDGTPYAAPLQASVKSLIWYSPTAFAAAGYEVPTTWAELEALTTKVVADHLDGQVTPWCLGLEDGESSGWVMTDWLEDTMLATQGPAAYDDWAEHRVPLDSQSAVDALATVSSLVLADGHVQGGRVGARSTSVEGAGQQLVDGQCLMLHASSSYETMLPEGTVVTDVEGKSASASAKASEAASASAATSEPAAEASVSGAPMATDVVSAFAVPSDDDSSSPALVGGDYLVAFDQSEASQAVMTYLTSTSWAQARVALGGVATANRGVDASQITSDVARRATQTLQSRQTAIRLDASDGMPSPVGTDALWKALSAFTTGEVTGQEALTQAEKAWPKG